MATQCSIALITAKKHQKLAILNGEIASQKERQNGPKHTRILFRTHFVYILDHFAYVIIMDTIVGMKKE